MQLSGWDTTAFKRNKLRKLNVSQSCKCWWNHTIRLRLNSQSKQDSTSDRSKLYLISFRAIVHPILLKVHGFRRLSTMMSYTKQSQRISIPIAIDPFETYEVIVSLWAPELFRRQFFNLRLVGSQSYEAFKFKWKRGLFQWAIAQINKGAHSVRTSEVQLLPEQGNTDCFLESSYESNKNGADLSIVLPWQRARNGYQRPCIVVIWDQQYGGKILASNRESIR